MGEVEEKKLIQMNKEDYQLSTFWEEGLKIQLFSLKIMQMKMIYKILQCFKIIDRIYKQLDK